MSKTLDELVELVEARTLLPDPEVRRRIRRDAKVSAAQIAEVIGVSEAAIRHWERGVREPSDEYVIAYVGALSSIAEATGPAMVG